ncbi:MAG: hypothetical protein Q8934_06675 [Bacillota bacterium]|nr:hypothetical protein [Bacillota bacterium]
MLKRIPIAYLFVAVLFFTSLGSGAVFAADGQYYYKERYCHDPEIIKKKAEKLGIETKGKDTKTIVKEMKEMKIKKAAKELGIPTDNKDLHSLIHEVRDKRIYNAAVKLGIKTEGRTTHEIFKEMMTNHADKVKS